MPYQLSEGVIKRILDGEAIQKPVFQILGYKQIPGNQSDKYRLVISDGVCAYSSAVLGKQLAYLIPDGNLEKYTVIQVHKYVRTLMTAQRKILLILELEIMAPGAVVGQRIGHPTPLESACVSNFGGRSSNSPSGNPKPFNRIGANFGIKQLASSLEDNRTPVVSVGPDSDRVTSNSVLGNPTAVEGSGSDFGKTSTSNYPVASTSPGARSSSHTVPVVHPISSLTPYQNKWTIRSRVTNKTPVHEYNNSRGEGKIFSIDCIDSSGEIRAVVFNEYVDRFYSSIEINKVYYISKARLKLARKQFTSIKNNYELSFTDDTTVVPCEDHCETVPSLGFNFISINEVDDVDINSIVDIIAICRKAFDVETVLCRRNGREVSKRNVVLVDQTNSEVTLTLWRESAETFDGGSNPVVALKGVKISDYKFRSLSAFNSTIIYINPDIPEARNLREWFESEGRHNKSLSISHPLFSNVVDAWKTLIQAKQDMQGMECEPAYYKAKATIVEIKRENCMYMSCSSEGCLKKVNALDSGKYECPKCRCEYDDCKWRLLLNVSVADFSENQWVTSFSDTAESILKKSAQELRELSQDALDDVFSKIKFESFIFEMRSKLEMFNEESRLKTIVFEANPLDPVDYSKKLLKDIREIEEFKRL